MSSPEAISGGRPRLMDVISQETDYMTAVAYSALISAGSAGWEISDIVTGTKAEPIIHAARVGVAITAAVFSGQHLSEAYRRVRDLQLQPAVVEQQGRIQ